MAMDSRKDRRRTFLICLGLALGTAAVLGQVISHDFVSYDDWMYVVDNPQVQRGFNAQSLAWAFSSGYASNWHPLTWLSHVLDVQLYGLHPAGHHLTSLIFHLANSLLLFGCLRRMTAATWRSALVAALFAWHPLHVESVAWVAERKDVLSGFFWLLTLWAWGNYAEKPGWHRYLPPLFLFWLGLLSKPMVVTLPCVLLLLDYWPLGRSRGGPPRVADSADAAAQANPWSWPRLLIEKVPFFLSSVTASFITFVVQSRGGAMSSQAGFPLSARIANAVVAYVRYLGKLVWPRGLMIFYPHPPAWPVWQVVGAALVLAAITAAVIGRHRRQPYLVVGWLWFLGTLVPVIGLVQVGLQSMADRYTYLPSIGIFIMVAWGGADVARRWPRSRPALAAAAVAALAACLGLTWSQAQTWRDSLSVSRHAIAVMPANFVAHDNLGITLERLGRNDEAIAEFNIGRELQPRAPLPLHALGQIAARRGDFTAATSYYLAALRNQPDYGPAINDLARLLISQGKLDEATGLYEECLRLHPDWADVHYNLANLLATQGRLPEAVKHYQASLRAEPDAADAHNNLGAVLAQLGQLPEATTQFQLALQLRPDFPEAHDQLGGVLQRLGRLDAARDHYAEAVRLKPDFTHARLRLGLLLAQQGEFEAAGAAFRETLRRQPDSVDALWSLTWVEATSRRPELRNGPEAVKLAERACELTRRQDLRCLAALDVAYAEAGRFADAISTAREVQELAVAGNQPVVAEQAAARLALYAAGKPFHE